MPATTPGAGAGAPHVVVVPLPAQGHINPMMQIARFLAASGITVTFVHTTRSHSLLNASACPDQTSASDRGGCGGGSKRSWRPLRMEVIEDGLPSDCKRKNLTLEMIRSTITPVMRRGLEELLQKLMMEQPAAAEEEALPPPCCLILDGFLSWGLDVALRFGLPRVVLWTCSATVFSMGLHVPELIAKGYIPPAPPTQQGNSADKLIDFIPGVPPFCVWDMPASLIAAEGLQSIAFKFFRSVFELSIKDADCILVNTVYELESTVLDALTSLEQADLSCIQPVGPLCMLSSLASSMPNCTSTAPDQPATASLLCEDNSCLCWLDQQPESSVMYISFGSLVSVEDDIFTELAYGLEASGERFLWVIRPDVVAGKGSIEELLPEGFLKRTCERGVVISWVPQLAVLGHPSVGAFLTHCGWNSVLESLSKGVPMLGFPNLGDQPTNLKCMVQDWEVGLPLPSAGGKVERADVQGAVSGMMRGEAGMRVRGRAREWKHIIADKALANATCHLQKLVDDLQNGRLKGPKRQNGHDFKVVVQNGHPSYNL